MRRAECGYDFGEGDGIEQNAILLRIRTTGQKSGCLCFHRNINPQVKSMNIQTVA